MSSLLERWGCLGINVVGQVNPYEDPEVLIADSLESYEEEPRVLTALATWLARYGHLILTKKLKCRSERARRLLSALIEITNTKEKKLLTLLADPSMGPEEFLYRDMPKAVQRWWKKNLDECNPHMRKYGFIMKEHELVRPKILLSPMKVYERSKILTYRALYGCSLRSDLLALFPQLACASLRELARRLHVTAAAVHPVISDLMRSGLLAWEGSGPRAKLRWIGVEGTVVSG